MPGAAQRLNFSWLPMTDAKANINPVVGRMDDPLSWKFGVSARAAEAARMPSTCRRLVVAALTLTVATVGAPLAPAAAARSGLKAEYFDYTDLTGEGAERLAPTGDFGWDEGAPAPGGGAGLSVR